MSYMLHVHQCFLLVHYLENSLENEETQENTQAAIRTDILLCLCTPGKINKGTKKQFNSA